MANVMGMKQLSKLIEDTKATVVAASMKDESTETNQKLLMDDLKLIGAELEMEPSLISAARKLHEVLVNADLSEHAHQFEIDIAYATRNLVAA